MELKWTSRGLSDLARLYDFLAAVDVPAAARAVQQLGPSRQECRSYSGPSGQPNPSHNANKAVQLTNNAKLYGSIIAINVPTPASL